MSTAQSLDDIIQQNKKANSLKKKTAAGAKKSAATTKKTSATKPSGGAQHQPAQKKGEAKRTAQKQATPTNGAVAKAAGTHKKPNTPTKSLSIQVKSPSKQPEIVVRTGPKPKTVDPHSIVLQIVAPRAPVNKVVVSASDNRAKRAAETRKDVQNKREAMMAKARAAPAPSGNSKPTSLSDRFASAGSR